MAQTRKIAPHKWGPGRNPVGDPAGRGMSGGVGWGGLLVVAVGFVFVGYVFNVGGMQITLDGWFGGLHHAARAHDRDVQRVYLAALPVIAALLVLFVLWVLLFAGGGESGQKKKTQRKRENGAGVHAPQVAKVESEAAHAFSGPAFVRPVRLSGVVDRGVLLETKERG